MDDKNKMEVLKEIRSHMVEIPGSKEKFGHTLLMSSYQTTQKQYEAIMGQNPSHFKNEDGADYLPVESVDWFCAVEYCNKLSEIEGLKKCYKIKGKGDNREVWFDDKADGYRLPESEEWEYAARGGDLDLPYEYPGSNNLDEVSWYRDNSGSKPHPVGEKKPVVLSNGGMLFDMSGNVWEWSNTSSD
jgi:formylglycine-generating enzyme